MSPTVEFGSKDAADAAREQWADHLCPDDDRRLKTVRFVEDVPDRVLERAELEAADSRDEHESGPGQAELTDHERDRIDFSKGRANVPWAQSIKAIATDAGVDDWTAHVDPTLTVDEHREVMEQAAREDQGQRMDAEDSAIEKAGQHSRRAQSNECDHARGHCEHGDPDACEFLQERCGFDEDEVATILDDSEDMPGRIQGARSQLWTQYQVGPANAKEAAAAINEINRQYGDDLVSFEELGDRELTPEQLNWDINA